MNTVWVEVKKRYPVHILGSGVEAIALINPIIANRQVIIVSNVKVADLYLKDFAENLTAKAINKVILADGEQHKNFASFMQILEALIANKYNRDCCVIALGGGVVGDIAGFVAHCYQRGVDIIQIPTTLLAQVDAAIGGKTAINHQGVKNIIGAFQQPVAVFSIFETLKTLPKREYIAGIAEVIKVAAIFDKEFFEWLQQHVNNLLQLEQSVVMLAIHKAASLKAKVVSIDEHDLSGKRALLNFGHTFAHAIESVTGYNQYLHGEAVALGMQIAADLSFNLGMLKSIEVQSLKRLIIAFGLPAVLVDLPLDRFTDAMNLDKKIAKQQRQYVLLSAIGEAKLVDNVEPAIFKQTLDNWISK